MYRHHVIILWQWNRCLHKHIQGSFVHLQDMAGGLTQDPCRTLEGLGGSAIARAAFEALGSLTSKLLV